MISVRIRGAIDKDRQINNYHIRRGYSRFSSDENWGQLPAAVERELMARLRRRLPPHPLLRLGPGGYAAVLQMTGVRTVRRHGRYADRRRRFCTGRRGSAASGPQGDGGQSERCGRDGSPVRWPLVVAVFSPRRGGLELAVELFEGFLPLAEQYNVAIAGGDTNSWNGPLVAQRHVARGGDGARPLRRSGARPGDRIS